MTVRTISALLFGVAVLIGCGPTLHVKTDFDHAAQFAHYRSFQMGEGRVIEKGTVTDNTIVKDRVDAAIRGGLAARGLVQNADRADLIARFAVGARTVRELEGVGYPLAVGVWGAYPEDFWVSEHPEGTLVIDLVDARSQKLVWRAYCTAEGSDMADPAFIQKAVNRAFGRFPPA
ncbi:MAG TPA: DUF4136 domain-containing protein [Polyangia bacterium]|nr:DUF4136 domain-containing protein [Polyangia bacterium]